ncbi:hypothetical protein [Paraburkholderia hospita]|uniref:hypothetical protein n=1 Tax=Paraburkholderia hospita TaxID=169430 RepID=UPI003ECEE0B3
MQFADPKAMVRDFADGCAGEHARAFLDAGFELCILKLAVPLMPEEDSLSCTPITRTGWPNGH